MSVGFDETGRYLICDMCDKPFGEPLRADGDLKRRRIAAIKQGWRRPQDLRCRRFDLCFACRDNIELKIWQRNGWENHWTWPRQDVQET